MMRAASAMQAAGHDKPIVSAASYPPSPKARGRGTHSFKTGNEIEAERVGHPPENNVGPHGLEIQPCWDNGYTAQVTRGNPACGFENCITSTFKWIEEHPVSLGTYNRQWNNSNMLIQRLIEGCGGKVHFPRYVFWYYPQDRSYGGSMIFNQSPID